MGFRSISDSPTFIDNTSPLAGETDVAVTRETIIRFTNALRTDTVVPEAIFAQFAGKFLPARQHISPDQTTISSLLAHIRRGDVAMVHSLRRGAAQAIEAVAHGDRRTSKVVGRRVDEIKLPAGASVDAILRGDKVIIAHHDTVIEADDHVILFLIDKKRVRDVERLFQVGVTFL